ncbi:unnamed protein product [Cuscuta epithymum]|nr:unnamed protein product [Cuscuta epithymum]
MALYRPRINTVQMIVAPQDRYINYFQTHAFTRSTIEDGDILWFATLDSNLMEVFMLPKSAEDGVNCVRPTTIPRNEWVLMYHMSVDSVWNDIALVSSRTRRRTIKDTWGKTRARSIFMDAFFPANKKKKTSLALILRVELGDIFLYDLDRSIEPIRYHGRMVTTYEVGYDSYTLTLCPYLEPSSLSAYVLK